MAKIKSTLDLIMEKTQHMTLSEEEKKALKHKELEETVRAFTYRFINNERESETLLLRELERIPQEDRQEARRLCLRLLAGHISPSDENERIPRALHAVLGCGSQEAFQGLMEGARKEFDEKLQGLREEAIRKSREHLASRGIRGSALIPIAEATPFWQEEFKKLVDSFREALTVRLEEFCQR